MNERPCDTCRSKGDTSLADLNADPIDFAFLTAARYFFLSFSEMDSNAWLSAFLCSQNFFPDSCHAETMRRALAVVHEMRVTRKSMFRFSNPRCQGCSMVVTEDERHLVQLIQHARVGRHSKVASSAMLLCEGNPVDRVIAAAHDFAETFSLAPTSKRAPGVAAYH